MHNFTRAAGIARALVAPLQRGAVAPLIARAPLALPLALRSPAANLVAQPPRSLHTITALSSAHQHGVGAAHAHTPPDPAAAHAPATFSSIAALSSRTQGLLRTAFRYENMSPVQAACIPLAMEGGDMVARAKTGTGKTLAFLIPLVEHTAALKARSSSNNGDRKRVLALVISPTRELAQQIEEECKRLLPGSGLHVACSVGGLSISRDLRALDSGVDILVATPGRLKDLLENTPSVKQQLQGVKQLVLDEADRLLDMGFKRDLDRIFSLLPPPSQRQTQLFSATFPPNVKEIAKRSLRPNYTVVNTVGESDQPTHVHVKQEFVVLPLSAQLPALHSLLVAHRATTPHPKVIVFFTTAKMTAFAADLFGSMRDGASATGPLFELHSRLSQTRRSRTTDEFRGAKQGTLFSSDVSARGIDVPDITLVVQVGLPSGTDQYVHRLGRTARAGKTGEGVLLLAPFEQHFLDKLRGEQSVDIKPLDVKPNSPLHALQQSSAGQQAAHPLPASHPVVEALSLVASNPPLAESAAGAYRASLGFYNSSLRACGFTSATLVQCINQFALQGLGLREVPALEARTVAMMGLKGTPGLRIEAKGRVQQGSSRPQYGHQQQKKGPPAAGGKRAERGSPASRLERAAFDRD